MDALPFASSASTSPTSGPTHPVASMVVFEAALQRSRTTDASSFAISAGARTTSRGWKRSSHGGGAVQRTAGALAARPAIAPFAVASGLIVIDGGKGQLSSGM